MAKRSRPEEKKTGSVPPSEQVFTRHEHPLLPPQLLEEEHVELQVENQQLREAQMLLEESRERFADLFHKAPIAYVILDPIGLIKEANVQAVTLLGQPQNLLSFFSFRQFVDDRDQDRFLAHLERCRQARNERVTTHLQLKTLPPRVVELVSHAICSALTGALTFQTAIIDRTALVTAEREAQQSEERYRLLFNTMAEVFALGEALRDEQGTVVDFRIVQVNAAWEHSTGIAAAQAIGQTLRDIAPGISQEWYSAMAEVLKYGTPLRKQIRDAARDRWLILSAFKVQENRVAILLLDITDRRRTEEALAQSEQEYRLLFEENPVAMWIFDVDSLEILQANRAALAQYGYTREEFLTSRLPDLIVPELRQKFYEALQLHHPPAAEAGVWEHMRKDGTRINVEIAVHELPLKGRKTRLVHAKNVTARVRAEDALRQSEELNRRIIESSADCITVLDLEGNLLSMSLGGQSLLKIDDIARYTNVPWINLWCEADKPKVTAELASARSGKIGKFSAYAPTMKGEPKWWDVVITPIVDENGEPERLLAVSHDVTESVRAEEALRQRDELLGYHIENSPLAVIEWDGGYIVKLWSPAAERIFGWTAEECLGKEITSLNMIYPEDVPIVDRTMERLSSGKEKSVVSENRNMTKDGRVINCVWYNSVLTDANGTLSSVLSLVEDVTAERKATAVLEKTLNSLSVLISNSIESMVLVGPEGTVLCASKRAALSLGYTPTELEGKHWNHFVPEEQRTAARFYYADFLRNRPEQATATLKLQTAEGELAWCALQASMVSLGDGNGYLIYLERVSPDEETKDSENRITNSDS